MNPKPYLAKIACLLAASAANQARAGHWHGQSQLSVTSFRVKAALLSILCLVVLPRKGLRKIELPV